MIRNKSLWIGLLSVVALVAIVEIWGPKTINWAITLDAEDKIPYGTYVLQNEFEQRFEDYTRNHLTFYEINQLEDTPGTIFSLAQEFNLDSLDGYSLYSFAEAGGVVFLGAWDYWGWLADTLNLETNQNFVLGFNLEQGVATRDSVILNFVNPNLDPNTHYWYKSPVAEAHFVSFDTARSKVVAVNQQELPVLLEVSIGEGKFYLSSTPLVFSNYYLLKAPNETYVEGNLSLLDQSDLMRTEYYQSDPRSVAFETPLRFVVEDRALKWAYWVSLAALLIFVVFEAKRKQKAIPIINPLKNTTLDFTNTMGRLYFEQGNHANITHKMITYLLEDIRQKFYLPTNKWDQDFYQSLSKKSGVEASEVLNLFKLIKQVTTAPELNDQNLLALNKKITAFRNAAQLNS